MNSPAFASTNALGNLRMLAKKLSLRPRRNNQVELEQRCSELCSGAICALRFHPCHHEAHDLLREEQREVGARAAARRLRTPSAALCDRRKQTLISSLIT